MRQIVVLTAMLVLTACANSSTTSSTTSATVNRSTTTTQVSTTTTEASTTTTRETEGRKSAAIEVILEELRSELATWNLSEDSIQCVTDGLIDGGYIQPLGDLGFLDIFLMDDSAPLSELPPEMAHFTSGLFYYLYDPQGGCLRPSELTLVLETLGTASVDYGYSSYGDDPTLDELYDGCAAGSPAECDMLYLVADFGSEYEAMATTCGELVEEIDTATTCMAELQDFSERDDLATQCEDGFFIACDTYFAVSAAGSEEEALATSCGGVRDPVLTTPCWFTFGFGTR